jgi:hypothetical protein
MKGISKIGSFFLFPILVYLAHLISLRVLHLYTFYPNLDMPFHYVGGLSIAFTASQILSHLESEKVTTPLNRIIFLVLLLSVTAITAAFWEFAEFISDQVLGTELQPSIANTMQDQFLGILGGGTWAFIYYLRDSDARRGTVPASVRSMSKKR